MSVTLIDGSNLFSIMYAANSTMDANGTPIGGASGMVKFLAKFCAATSTSKMIVFFDGEGGSAKRKMIYKEYKGGRSPRRIIGRRIGFSDDKSAMENKDFQFNLLLSLLECLPINVIITSAYEADDGIAYFVKYRKHFGCAENEDVYIVSSDRDFCQLISEHVWVYNPINKIFITESNFAEKYEVNQKNWLLYRAICGDDSDNIDGVSGVGLKTLKKVIPISENIEFGLESIDKLDESNKIAKKIKDAKEIIERNWKLMNLGEPLISNDSVSKLDYQLKNFEPKVNKKDFVVRSMMVPTIDVTTTVSFNSLLLRK